MIDILAFKSIFALSSSTCTSLLSNSWLAVELTKAISCAWFQITYRDEKSKCSSYWIWQEELPVNWPFKFTLEFIFFTLKLQLLDDDLWQIDCFNCLITFVDARKRIWEKSARRHVSKTRKKKGSSSKSCIPIFNMVC